MSRLYVTVEKNGQRGLQALPDPPPRKSWMVVPCDTQLVERVSELDGNGHWERELSELLAQTIERFFLTRPISIATPGRALESMKLYDPRDRLKERIN